MDRRVVGWSAGRHVDRPCGLQILPWPARKVTEILIKFAFWRGLGRGKKLRKIVQKCFFFFSWEIP